MPSQTESLLPPVENSITPEVTVDSLFATNNGMNARERLALWEETQVHGLLPVFTTCGDARIMLPSNASYIKTIAAGGNPEEYQGVYDQAGGIIALSHLKCGGQHEKAVMNGNGAEVKIDGNEPGVYRYVRDYVHHSDPYINALLIAARIAKLTNKPVLAATQDHDTLTNFPIEVITKGSFLYQLLNSDVPIQQLVDMMGSDRPVTSTSSLPEYYQQVLADCERRASVIRRLRPNLKEEQQVQNPSILYITTDPRPGSVKYPDLLGMPNTVFALRTNRMDRDTDGYCMDNNAVERAVHQAQYPILHAYQNRENPGGAFHRLRVIFVDTRYEECTKDIIEALTHDSHTQDFMRLRPRIIGGVSNQGMLQECREFKI